MFHVEGVRAALGGGGRKATVRAVREDGFEKSFQVDVRVDAARGGILPEWRDTAVRVAAVGGGVGEARADVPEEISRTCYETPNKSATGVWEFGSLFRNPPHSAW